MNQLNKRLGVMQGRLSPSSNGLIQSFPVETWEQEFYVAREMGLGFIEWTLDQFNLLENPLLTSSGRDIIKGLVRKTGIGVPSVTGDCFMHLPLQHDKDHIGRIELILEAMSDVGNCSTLVIPFVDQSALCDSDAISLVQRKLMDFESLLEQTGTIIAIESDFEPSKIIEFLEPLDPSYYGVTFDMGNSASLGWDPAYELETLSSRLRHLHVKDRVIGGHTVALGTGAADFQSIFQSDVLRNYRGILTLQVARAFDHISPRESVQRAHDYVMPFVRMLG